MPTAPPSASWSSSPARAPRILPAPDPAQPRVPDLYLHLVSYDESNEFHEPVAQYWTALTSRLPETSAVQLPHWHVPPLLLDGTQNGLRVRFSWLEVPGAPARAYTHAWEQVELLRGQWMQVRFTARHVDDEGRWYDEQHVLNLGVAGGFTPDLFLNLAPDYQVSDLADPAGGGE